MLKSSWIVVKMHNFDVTFVYNHALLEIKWYRGEVDYYGLFQLFRKIDINRKYMILMENKWFYALRIKIPIDHYVPLLTRKTCIIYFMYWNTFSTDQIWIIYYWNVLWTCQTSMILFWKVLSTGQTRIIYYEMYDRLTKSV